MRREVKAWISSLALTALVAAATLVLPAHAQTITWKVDGPASCTVTCAAAGTPAPVPPGPPQVPVPAEPTPADPCARHIGNFLLYDYCRQGVAKPTPAPIGDSNPPPFDPWTHRDLTGTHGNVLRMQGPAGHAEVFQMREPAGKRVTIKAFRVPSNFGACERLQITVQGKTIQGGGSDAQATATIVSTGNDPVTLVLHCAGGAGIQINPG